jgi:hypothetical protein
MVATAGVEAPSIPCWGRLSGGGISASIRQLQAGTIAVNSNILMSGAGNQPGSRAIGGGLYFAPEDASAGAITGITANGNRIIGGYDCGGGGVYAYLAQFGATVSNITATGNSISCIRSTQHSSDSGAGYSSEFGTTLWGPGRNISGNTGTVCPNILNWVGGQNVCE